MTTTRHTANSTPASETIEQHRQRAAGRSTTPDGHVFWFATRPGLTLEVYLGNHGHGMTTGMIIEPS